MLHLRQKECRVNERETCRGATVMENEGEMIVTNSTTYRKTPLNDFSTFRENTRKEKRMIAEK